MKTFLDYLQEAVQAPAAPKKIRGGDKYEADVMRVLAKIEKNYPTRFRIDRSVMGGGSDAHGAGDIMLIVNGVRMPIEIKMNRVAQMGGTSVRYERSEGKGYYDDPMDAFVFVDTNLKEEDKKIYLDAIASSRKLPALDAWMDHINGFTKTYHTKSGKIVTVNDVSFVGKSDDPAIITKEAWDSAQKLGLLKAINSKVSRDAEFICDHYQKKNPPVNYIQIGGAGLFHTGKNPLGIKDIPKLQGDINVEMRVGPRGTEMNRMLGVETKGYTLRLQGRLKFKAKSNHSLDNYEDAVRILGLHK